MTYLVLSVVFLAVVALVVAVALASASDRARVVRRWWPGILIAAVVVLVLTAVFDNLMIGSGLMEYDESTLAGVRLGIVPVEDFAYPIAALLLLPALWLLFRKRAR